jgi:hypothetical protein
MRVPTTEIRPNEITPLMEARFWELVDITFLPGRVVVTDGKLVGCVLIAPFF